MTIVSSKEISIYLVDDDDEVRHSLQVLLEAENFNVETYASAEAFLAAYKPKPLSCLLLDISMPDMTGVELQAFLNKNLIRVPIIFLSGYSVEYIENQVKLLGAIDLIEKPFTVDRLLRSIQKAISSYAQLPK